MTDVLSQEGFEKACATAEVPTMMPKKVELSTRSVLVCREGDSFYAVDEICPHKQKSMAMGLVFEGKIVCPWHQYGFNLETGRCDQRRCAPVETYEVRVVDDVVYVRV
jgi:nitrite reductase (NADH) small subunit